MRSHQNDLSVVSTDKYIIKQIEVDKSIAYLSKINMLYLDTYIIIKE